MSNKKIRKKIDNMIIKKAFESSCVVIDLYKFKGQLISKDPNELIEHMHNYLGKVFPKCHICLMIAPASEMPPPEKLGEI